VRALRHLPWGEFYSIPLLVEGGDGLTLADGAAFLLPYYMGLDHLCTKE
jgi:hypothetical protein